MEDIKKVLTDLENKINGLEKGIENLRGDLTQTFTHNFDKLIKQEETKQEEAKEEVKQEEKILEDF